MDEELRNKLSEISTSLSIYSIRPPAAIEEAFNFKVDQIGSVHTSVISKFVIMLAQYLITLQVRYNTSRVMAGQKKKVLDRKIQQALKATKVPGKTMEERKSTVISADPELQELESSYNIAAAERDLLEGLDGPITELINAFKAELRRQSDERHYIEQERRKP